MSEHESHQGQEQGTSEDSKIDAFAAVALVLLGATFCLYWVAMQ